MAYRYPMNGELLPNKRPVTTWISCCLIQISGLILRGMKCVTRFYGLAGWKAWKRGDPLKRQKVRRIVLLLPGHLDRGSGRGSHLVGGEK